MTSLINDSIKILFFPFLLNETFVWHPTQNILFISLTIFFVLIYFDHIFAPRISGNIFEWQFKDYLMRAARPVCRQHSTKKDVLNNIY